MFSSWKAKVYDAISSNDDGNVSKNKERRILEADKDSMNLL
jgi:hypothetical protein